jgi:RNA polymerase sigma factor (sigma-70 family)
VEVDLRDAPDGESASVQRAWVDGIRRGEAAALEAAVKAYGPRLVGFAAGIVVDGAAAEDIVQDVFWRIWDGRASWTIQSSLQAYLFTAVRNRALTAIARRQTRAQHVLREQRLAESDVGAALAASPGEIFDAAESDAAIVAALRHAFLRLTERQQTAVRLRYEEGLSYPELASVLGITVSGAEQLMARALRALRESLARSDPRGR